MFTRVITYTGATHLDEGVEFVREQALPILHQQRGFAGLTVSLDRSSGLLGVLSLWSTAEDRDNSESGLDKTRQEGLAVIGGTLTVERYEEVVLEVARAPFVGASLMVRRLTMDPAAIDDNLRYFTTEVLPQIKATPGFCAVRNMIDRTTGAGIVGSVWTDVASMRTAAEMAEARRADAATHGVQLLDQSQREIVLADFP